VRKSAVDRAKSPAKNGKKQSAADRARSARSPSPKRPAKKSKVNGAQAQGETFGAGAFWAHEDSGLGNTGDLVKELSFHTEKAGYALDLTATMMVEIAVLCASVGVSYNAILPPGIPTFVSVLVYHYLLFPLYLRALNSVLHLLGVDLEEFGARIDGFSKNVHEQWLGFEVKLLQVLGISILILAYIPAVGEKLLGWSDWLQDQATSNDHVDEDADGSPARNPLWKLFMLFSGALFDEDAERESILSWLKILMESITNMGIGAFGSSPCGVAIQLLFGKQSDSEFAASADIADEYTFIVVGLLLFLVGSKW
jgi:hypothetical protein